jgi:hypothetical protein
MLVGAFYFICDGIWLLRGTFRDPYLDGVLCIFIGLSFLGFGYSRFAQVSSLLAFVVDISVSFIFLAAGILVFLGRKQYLAWKADARPGLARSVQENSVSASWRGTVEGRRRRLLLVLIVFATIGIAAAVLIYSQ